MWTLLIDHQEDFKALTDHFKSQAPENYQSLSTETQAEAWISAQKPWPHLIYIPYTHTHMRSTLLTLYKKIIPDFMFITGRNKYIGIGQVEDTIFIPEVCYRLAGRLDIGYSPILYEEMYYHGDLQKTLYELLGKEPSTTRKSRLFSTEGPLKDFQERWIFNHLNCWMHDTISGSALQIAKRVGIKLGCLRIFDGPDSKNNIIKTWQTIIERRPV